MLHCVCRFKSSYRDALLDGFPDTTYFDYGFGGDFYHRLWSEVRIVFTSRPTRHNQRYSTQQLYAGESGPAGWDIGYQGAIDELEVMRPEEFATKDYNNAPFVAAGWKWQARPRRCRGQSTLSPSEVVHGVLHVVVVAVVVRKRRRSDRLSTSVG